MTGSVDSLGRALLRVQLQHPQSAGAVEMEAWIDTGFTGELVIPQQQIAALGLPLGPVVKAILADGSQIDLDTYHCLVDWFGAWRGVEVGANQGQFPLLGIGLLLGRELQINYQTKVVNLA
jgi:clan AA aspartic protease